VPKKRVPGARRTSAAESAAVFLNIPYDRSSERLFLAYIAGVSAFGIIPRATLEIPGSARRLDRILALIESCEYSVHDISRVQLDRNAPATPRFNMPFELGLAVAWEKLSHAQEWFVFEERPWRAQKSLSDLSGTDVYIHGGTVRGVFRELCNAFVRRHPPTVQQMAAIYRVLRKRKAEILRRTGTASVFNASVFQALVATAQSVRNQTSG
jgi:hypothetical protein